MWVMVVVVLVLPLSLIAASYADDVPDLVEYVRERLEELVAAGANHLLLNPVCRHAEQLEALAAVVGLT